MYVSVYIYIYIYITDKIIRILGILIFSFQTENLKYEIKNILFPEINVSQTLLWSSIFRTLALTLLTWIIWRAPNNACRWQIGFNSAFKGLIRDILKARLFIRFSKPFRLSLTQHS